MTTDPPVLPIRGAALALAIWFGAMTAAALVVTPTRVVAFGSPDRLIGAAPDLDASILDAGAAFVTLRPGGAHSVAALYRHGAWLVWPMIGAGCGGARPG